MTTKDTAIGEAGRVTHRGGCHCGAVRFRVEAAIDAPIVRCNCSICSMTGFLHLIVPARDFSLLSGADDLVTYRFGTGLARHLFCRCCGIKSFYVPRSNPDGYSINVRCLEAGTLEPGRIEEFDGRNWEQGAERLRHLSQ